MNNEINSSRWCLTFLCALAVSCSGRDEPRTETATPATSNATSPGDQNVVGSSTWHLELGKLYVRFGDSNKAVEQLEAAAERATSPSQVIAACVQLGRTAEQAGDRGVAIAAYERVLAAGASESSAGAPTHVAVRLATLYGEEERFEEADRLCRSALANVSERYEQNRIRAVQVDLYRRSGVLNDRVAEWRNELDATEPDEERLWLLAMALGAGRGSVPGVAVPPSSGGDSLSGPDWQQLTGVLHALHQLHPDDRHLRGALVEAYERADRIDEAVALLKTTPLTAAPDSSEPGRGACPQGLALPAKAPTLARAERVVQLLVRAGRAEEALAEIGTIEKLARTEEALRVSALISAARLYVTHGSPDRAEAVMVRAQKAARTTEDRRAVAVAQLFSFEKRRHVAGIAALHRSWAQSDDPCLQQAAARFEQEQQRISQWREANRQP